MWASYVLFLADHEMDNAIRNRNVSYSPIIIHFNAWSL